MSTIRVVNLQHTDATEPNIVLLADGTAVFASGITISGGTNLTVSGTAEFASGTVSAPGVTFIDDNNTGLYSPAADTVAITTAATERVRVDNAGNVGIGTTSPATALEVQSASNTSIRIDNEDDSTATLVFHNTGSTDRQISVTAGAMKFGGSSDEQMRIDSSGKVGIGTSSPSNILHIKNDSPTIRLESSASSYVGRNSIGQFQNGLYIECDNDNAIANSFTAFNVDGTERLRIDSSGNLSFSQEASSSPYPEQKLKWSNDSTTANGFYISQGTDRNGKIWHEQGLDIQFATSNTERMRITSAGELLHYGSSSNPGGATVTKKETVSGNSTLDLQIPGVSYIGHLYVMSIYAVNASVRTSRIYFITGRYGNSTVVTQLQTDDGSNGGRTFSIADVSAGVSNIIRFTDTSTTSNIVSMHFVGAIGS